jgi:type II secretory pathway component GspD/PulD (secretin)
MMSPRILLAFATLAGLPGVPTLADTPGGEPGADAPTARPDLDTVLDRPVKPLTSEKANLATLFYTIGRSYGVTITVDPKITGTALLRFNGGTLRQLLQTLLDTNDLFMETQGGVLAIKRTKNEFYFIEYPEISRSASASTSVSLSPSQGTTNGGFTGIGGQAMLPNSGQVSANGQQGLGSSGSTSFSISEKSGDSFWNEIESDIKEQKQDDEKISSNRFSGIISIETTLRRHEFWSQYIRLLNERINAQVLIEVRIDEITLNSAHKLGVDWTQVQTAIGSSGTTASVSTSTGITALAGATLPSNTLIGNFASGKLSAAITALQQQGDLKTITKPSLRLLNNQKGFVKVGEDRTFYSLFSNVTINQAGVVTPQTTTQNVYQGQQQTFGVVLPVTAQISRDGWVTLVMEPARTQLNGVDISPDGTQTSPDTNDESISTMLRLRDGQSAILGGLVSDTESKQSNGIPFLSSIPLLGRLARTDAATSAKNELIVTVSVHIIK